MDGEIIERLREMASRQQRGTDELVRELLREATRRPETNRPGVATQIAEIAAMHGLDEGFEIAEWKGEPVRVPDLALDESNSLEPND